MRWKGQEKWVPHKVKSPATEGQCQQVKDYLEFISSKKVYEDHKETEGDDKCQCVIQ